MSEQPFHASQQFGRNMIMKNRIEEELESLTNGQRRASIANGDMDQLASNIAKQAKQLQKNAEKLITEHPVAALSVAVVAGLALGWWVKRK
jgi:ElaB/YqjD/DUF883 family membrane-anchored ribosome-binding protein